MSAAITALQQSMFRLEEQLEDRNGQRNHLQTEVLKVRKNLDAAEAGLANHEAVTTALRNDLSSVRRAIKAVEEDERKAL